MRSSLLPILLGFSCATPTPPPEAIVQGTLPTEAISAQVEAVLDRSVDPCDDFYQFACGTWIAQTELPSDRPQLSRGFSSIYDENQMVVRKILDDAAAGTVQADPRLGQYYGGCMNTEALDAEGMASVQPILADIAAMDSATSLSAVIARYPMMDVFFGLSVDADFKNPDVNILHTMQGGLGLPERGYYFPEDQEGEELLAAYTSHVRRMLELFGLEPTAADLVVALETRLAEVSRAPAEMRDIDALYDIHDRTRLAGLAPDIPWDVILKDLGLERVESINVMTPEFFPEVGKILGEGDWEAVRAYVAWQFIAGAAPYLGSEVDEAAFAFFGTRLGGQQEQTERWKRCVDRTDGALGDLLGQTYVDRAFPGESKPKALAMIADIEHAFEAGLPRLDWMDDPTREKASHKLGTISNKIGYADSWETYSGLDLNGTHFDHHLAIARWQMTDHFAEVNQPVDTSKWYMTPPTVNAYYNPLNNEIVFPAGILQPPFFSASFPTAMNYGGMGMIMGHEVTHGFDDEGRKFAADGSLKEWWAEEVSTAFEERAQCVNDLYSTYEVQPGLTVNGSLTLGENIADLGGIRLAHSAYTSWVAAGGTDPEVAGFEGEQLLFVAYAQGWCTMTTPEMQKMRIETDTHSPPAFRVNGPLSQLPAFGEAWHCPIGSPMRPEEVCEVW